MTARAQTGLGVGRPTPKPGQDPKPKGRAVLSPPLRREIADRHAQQVFQEHLAPHFPRATYQQLAQILTARRVLPVRGRGPWDSMRVRNLLRRVQRSATDGAGHQT